MEEIIKEIAELIDCSNVVFLHRETGEILSYPAPDDSGYNEHDYLADEVMDIIDTDPDSYIKFTPLDSNESYQIMESFIENTKDPRLKTLLAASILAKKPFRSFRDALESEEMEDDWYDFKDLYLQMRVLDKM